MEEPSQNTVSPLLRFPPLATFALILILRNCLLRNLEVNDLEKELTPRNQAVVTLLMLAQNENDASRVSFENEVKDGRYFATGTSRRAGESLRANVDEGGEELLDKFGKDIVVLAEPKSVLSLKYPQTSRKQQYGARYAATQPC